MTTNELRGIAQRLRSRSAATKALPTAPHTDAACSQWARRAEDQEFERMREAFSRHGGLLSGEQLAYALHRRVSPTVALLARGIVARRVVHVVRHARILVPMFQFGSPSLELKEGVGESVAELGQVLDDWEVAGWFAQPTSLLNGAAPVDAFLVDPQAVIRAARAFRLALHMDARLASTTSKASDEEAVSMPAGEPAGDRAVPLRRTSRGHSGFD